MIGDLFGIVSGNKTYPKATGQSGQPLSATLAETAPQDTQGFQTQLYSRVDPNRKEQFLGDILSTEGISALQRGGTLEQGPIDYYSKLLSGNRQAMLSAEAPEVSNIMSSYNAARKSTAEFTPRGGGRVAQAENAPYAEQAQITSLLEKARPEAAAAMTQISQSLQSLGISEEELGSGAFQAVMNYNLGKSGNTDQLLAGAGKGVGSIIGALIESGAFAGA